MIASEFMCKMHLYPVGCQSYANGECYACRYADEVTVMTCDSCHRYIGVDEDYTEENGKHFCNSCK